MTLEKEFRKHLEEARLEEQKRVAKEIRDHQIENLSASYDKAMAYVNLIIIGGYASFFAMWAYTKEFLSRQQVLWAALIMSVSIVTFVFFEVYKMFFLSQGTLSLSNTLTDPTATDPKKLLGRIQEHNIKAREMNVRFGKIWYPVWIVTVTTALIAIAIMFYAFIMALIFGKGTCV